MIPREWGTLSAISGLRGEGRQQSLKSEIRKRSLKQRSKKQSSRLRGARLALTKGWAEVHRNDSLDWGLFSTGLDVWQPSWTRQGA